MLWLMTFQKVSGEGRNMKLSSPNRLIDTNELLGTQKKAFPLLDREETK